MVDLADGPGNLPAAAAPVDPLAASSCALAVQLVRRGYCDIIVWVHVSLS